MVISNIIIVIILILDYACVVFASQSIQDRDEALKQAYSQYCTSDIHTQVINQLSAPFKEYSVLHFKEFILKHRLK